MTMSQYDHYYGVTKPLMQLIAHTIRTHLDLVSFTIEENVRFHFRIKFQREHLDYYEEVCWKYTGGDKPQYYYGGEDSYSHPTPFHLMECLVKYGVIPVIDERA